MTDEQLAAIRARNKRADYVHSARWGEEPVDVQFDIDELLAEVDKLRASLNTVYGLLADEPCTPAVNEGRYLRALAAVKKFRAESQP